MQESTSGVQERPAWSAGSTPWSTVLDLLPGPGQFPRVKIKTVIESRYSNQPKSQPRLGEDLLFGKHGIQHLILVLRTVMSRHWHIMMNKTNSPSIFIQILLI